MMHEYLASKLKKRIVALVLFGDIFNRHLHLNMEVYTQQGSEK